MKLRLPGQREQAQHKTRNRNKQKGMHVAGMVKTGTQKKRIYLVITACLLAALAAVAGALHHNADLGRSREYLQKARESYVSGDYEGALLYLRRIEGGETDTETLMLMADCYEAMGNYPRALEMLRRLNTSDPAVAERIQSIEQRRAEQNQEERVTIAGIELARSSRNAALDGRGITDADLPLVAELYALETLSLRDNQIAEIEILGRLGGLDELDLSGNKIQDVTPLAVLRDLRILHLDRNPIRECDALRGLTNLKMLSLCGTQIDEDALTRLAESLPDCAILCAVDETEQILLKNRKLALNSEELLLPGEGITDISALSEFTDLKILDLSSNQISDLSPLMKLSKLERLNIAGNMVSDLRPLMGLPLLWSLNVSENQITETTSAGSLSLLKELNLSGNEIKDFSGLGKLSELTSLDVSATGITDMSLSLLYPLQMLHYLNLKDNEGLSDRAVGTLQSHLTSCSIATSELVYEVEFSGRVIRSDEKKLLMPASAVSSLSGLERLAQLEEIDLSGNMIESLYQFEITPSRETIRKVNLSGNRISDLLSLTGLTAIEELDLSGNRIENIAGLQKLTTLKQLNLSGNPVAVEAVMELREVLPNCLISY